MALDGQEVVPVEVVKSWSDTYTSRLERNLAAKVAAVTRCYTASALYSTILDNLKLIITKTIE